MASAGIQPGVDRPAPGPQANPAGLGPEQPWAAPVANGAIHGTVHLPGSKSLTARALVIAAVADAPTVLHAPLRARDTLLMAAGLAELGARVSDGPDGSWRIEPSPLAARSTTIDCGLAGTVARFLPPLAALGEAPIRFVGDPRMSQRPLRPLLDALRTLGAAVDADAIPVVVKGPVGGGAVDLDASTSSQLLSGLLLAGPAMPQGIAVRHLGPPVPSAHHVAMTVAMLREAGVAVDDSTPNCWRVTGGPLVARERTIEPDLSSASAFLAAAACTGGTVTIPAWPTSTAQPGAALPGLLEQMGCQSGLDAVGLRLVGPARLTGLTADLRDFPELALTVAALAALAGTPSRLTGIAHLRLQESDRLGVLAAELHKLGARIEVLPDGFAITPAPLSAHDGVTLDPHADHRVAMAFAVVGLIVPGVHIRNITTTDKTLPGFAQMWGRLVSG